MGIGVGLVGRWDEAEEAYPFLLLLLLLLLLLGASWVDEEEDGVGLAC